MSWAILGVVLAGLLFSAFFSGAETGLYRVNRLRLHLRAQQRDPKALRLAGVLEDEQGALSVTLIGTNVMNYITTTAVAYLFAEHWGVGKTDTEIYTVVIMTPIVFVFGEVVPKNLFQLHADRLMERVGGVLAVANGLFRGVGIVAALKWLAGVFNRLAAGYALGDSTAAPKRRMAAMLQEALAGGALAEDQSDLIDRVCRLSETPLLSAMVPRNRVTAIPARSKPRELMRVVRRTGYARLPVYDRDPRHMIALIKVDELLMDDDWETVSERARPTMTLGPHETVATALTRLRREGHRMAIVTDQGGQMLGLVTRKDLVREVVGEVASGV